MAVTEQEWLMCTNPKQMLDLLGWRANERKVRLFACASARRHWSVLPQVSRTGVRAAEHYADGLRNQAKFEQAVAKAREAGHFWGVHHAERLAAEAAASDAHLAALEVASGGPWVAGRRGTQEYQDEAIALCGLLRDLFGSQLFRPFPVIDATWLSWSEGAVVGLARAIYDERRFEEVPLLADALEEAGCTSEAILKHCREPGEHVRGCWVIDLILDKN